MRVLFLLASLLAQPAIAADVPISPTEFEALVTGKTLSYSSTDQQYGVEQYFDGRRVRWAYLDGACAEGRWYEAEDQVCFVYQGVDTPQCWSFYLQDDKLLARFQNNANMTDLHEVKRLPEPPQCPAPDFGV